MRSTVRFLCIFVAIAFLMSAGPERDSLKGLHHVSVLVEKLGSQHPADLSADALQTDTELRLRKVGINPDGGIFSDATLYVAVNCLAVESGWYACSDEVQILQPMTLVRDRTMTDPVAATWSRAGLQLVTSGRGVRDYVSDLVDKFLNDHGAANTESKAGDQR